MHSVPRAAYFRPRRAQWSADRLFVELAISAFTRSESEGELSELSLLVLCERLPLAAEALAIAPSGSS
jgi:hypothetical protein